jgi:hypothetical protein
MEPKGSLPHSQEPTKCHNPEQHQSSPCPQSHYLKIHFNITYNLNPLLPSGLFPSELSTKTLYAPLMTPIRVTCPTHIILLVLSANKVWWGLHIIRILFMFSPLPCYLVLLRPNTLFSKTLSLRFPFVVTALWYVSWCAKFIRWGVVSTTANPQAGGPSFSAICNCLFNIFTATLHTWRPFSIGNLRTRRAVVMAIYLWRPGEEDVTNEADRLLNL